MKYWVTIDYHAGMRLAQEVEVRADGLWLHVQDPHIDCWLHFTELDRDTKKDIVRQIMTGTARKVA